MWMAGFISKRSDGFFAGVFVYGKITGIKILFLVFNLHFTIARRIGNNHMCVF